MPVVGLDLHLKMKYRKILIIIFHLIGCISFLGLPFLFAPDEGTFRSWMNSPPGRRDLFSALLLIVFFYLNFYRLLPSLYFKGRKTVYFLIVTLCFFIVSFLPSIFTGGYHRRDNPQDFRQPPAEGTSALQAGPPRPGSEMGRPPGRPGIFASGPQFFLFLIVFLFSMGLAVHDRWRMEEKERIRVELHYLKSQLNPHFLFNAMNGIYSLALEKSDHAPRAVLMLSSMMRYVFSRDKEMLVSLHEELEYISNYISLQLIRYSDLLKVEYQVSGDASGKLIAPMILVPLVENAFKHGVNMEADTNIRIRINISTLGMEMEVFNHKVPLAGGHYDAPSGIGISNTKNRLELQYPGVHTLKILDDRNTFTSILYIQWIS
jgi:Histidine kinase